MVHPAAYPLTWWSCLKHHHDPQCFIWSLLAQHHQFCLLGQRHRKRMPRPTAALTFCTLPEHGPDPAVPDESLGSPICAALRALPQSRVRWAPMHSQPWSPSTTSGCLRDWSHCHPDQQYLLHPSSFPAHAHPGFLPKESTVHAGTVQTGTSTQAELCPEATAVRCTAMYPATYKQSLHSGLTSLPSEKVWGQHKWKYLCKLA